MNVKVRNLETSRGNSAANQFVINVDGKRIFQSYDSIIAVEYEDGRIELGEDWNYSRTTSKFRNQFLNETTAETKAKIESGEYVINSEL